MNPGYGSQYPSQSQFPFTSLLNPNSRSTPPPQGSNPIRYGNGSPAMNTLLQQQQQANKLGGGSNLGEPYHPSDFPYLSSRPNNAGLVQPQPTQSSFGLVNQLQNTPHPAEFNLNEDFPALPGLGSTARSPSQGLGASGSSDGHFEDHPSFGGNNTVHYGKILANQNQNPSISSMLLNNPSNGGNLMSSSPGSMQSLSSYLSASQDRSQNSTPLGNLGGTTPPSLTTSGPNYEQYFPQLQRTQPKTTGFMTMDRFGLLGLLGVIRMTDADLNTLALGTDLTTLGLNLNSSECLYSTFASPWAEGPTRREPEFYIPPCYYVQDQLQPAQQKMDLFSDETLFYIFYSMPKDQLQLTAAAMLYSREWRYHKEHRLWFTRVPNTEHIKSATHERGSYFYFDPSTWERVRKDNVVLAYDQLEITQSN
eukprot:TRINITY_DN7368_c0_g1_i2.p1 TRINITY_DN7368_c0_g1~~TRINITY_DN7368_c0_g1_i2.p1  ORF type:complete len:422 (-),score=95.44 TRINITY_DN7368_c0_g1_i2:153-1418(-)